MVGNFNGWSHLFLSGRKYWSIGCGRSRKLTIPLEQRSWGEIVGQVNLLDIISQCPATNEEGNSDSNECGWGRRRRRRKKKACLWMRLASHGLFLSSISAYLPRFYCWLCLNKTCLKSSYLHSDRQIQRRKLLGYVGGSLKRSDPQQTREGFFITITRCKITCNMQRSSQAANQHFLLHGIYSSITRVYMACQAICTSGFDLTKKIIKYPPPSNLRLILPFPPQ